MPSKREKQIGEASLKNTYHIHELKQIRHKKGQELCYPFPIKLLNFTVLSLVYYSECML